MRHTRLSLVLIALALVVAACTSDSDDTTTTTTTEPTTTETTTTTTEPPTTTEDTTTTTATTTEPTEATQIAYSIPTLNPPVAASAPTMAAPIDWGELGVRGLDRCAWTDTTDSTSADLRTLCRTKAIAHSTTTANDIQVNNETIANSFGGSGGLLVVRQPVGSTDHVCYINELEIVTPADLVTVQELLEQESVVQVAESLSGGLNAFSVDDPVEATTQLIAVGIPASPRYVLVPSPRWAFGPGGPALPADPAVVAMQDTQPPAEDAGTIFVIDTAEAGTEPTGLTAAIQGHSQFITGIIDRLLLNPTVEQLSAIETSSTAPPAMTEHSVVIAIDKAIGRFPEYGEGAVLNISLGTYACKPDHVPLELAAKLGEMAASGLNIAVVAAAGNDSHTPTEPAFWPAGFSDPGLVKSAVTQLAPDPNDKSAFETALSALEKDYPAIESALGALIGEPTVVGVGALVHDATADAWLPAAFSNQVAATVWAPGANIVSNYPQWAGFAQWDGTSFAAPHVAAVIAKCAGPNGDYRAALKDVANNGTC